MLENTIRITIILNNRTHFERCELNKLQLKLMLSSKVLFISLKTFLHLHLFIKATLLLYLSYFTHFIITLSFLVFIIVIVTICELAFLLRIISAILNKKIDVR